MGSGLRILGRLAVLSFAAAPLGACENQLTADSPADGGSPSSLGSGHRVRELLDPSSKSHPASGAIVSISGASFLTIDTYDETHDGKSKGSVYVQDVPPTSVAPPYSGVALYQPTYLPSNLKPAPGDVLDLTGIFSVSTALGAAVFSAGTALTQVNKPVVTPRFEYQLPAPVVIPASDLDDYAKGQQWVSMLVTVENVTFPDSLVNDGKGRQTVHIMSDATSNGPTLANELFDTVAWNSAQTTPPLAAGQTVKSITGIVTWFFNYHLCPRNAADIVVQ